MAIATVTADRSSILALPPGGSGLGGGNDAHLTMVASASGYDLRAVIGFSFPAGFFTPMRKITKVELLVVGTAAPGGGSHVAVGSSPFAYVYRVISAWSPNTAGESWSTSPIAYPGPSVTSTGGKGNAFPTASGAVVAIDITTIGCAWAPASVLNPAGAPCGGAVMYGVAIHEYGGAANAAEIHSAKAASAANRPVLRYTYETNAPPGAPTLIRPVGPDQAADDFEAQALDPEADAITAYDLQVSTDPAFASVTHWAVANATTGLTAAGHLLRNYGGTPMTVGDRYYWRCRMRDAGGFGVWSNVATFVKATSGGPAPDMYDYWAQAILSDMAEGRTVLRIGTLRPVDAEVAALICAEYGDLFRVKWDETTPQVDEPVYLLGERVSLSPDGWAVDAIVERQREVG
jgi:hypothetical protein